MPSLHDQLLAVSGTPALLSMHGEDVTFLPQLGPARIVRAAIEEIGNNVTREQGHEYDEQEIKVLCRRDPLAGIDAPFHGDKLLRASDVDPRQREFVFAGVIDMPASGDWVLAFKRKVPRRSGLEQRGGQ